MGGELGKELGDKVHRVLLAEDGNQKNDIDSSTQGLIAVFRSMKHKL